jgi:hypothetical protein
MVAADAFSEMRRNVLGAIKRIFTYRKYRKGRHHRDAAFALRSSGCHKIS